MYVGYNNSNTTFSGLVNLANSNSFLYKAGTGVMTLSGNNTGTVGYLKFHTTANIANEIVFAHAVAPGSMLIGFDVLGTFSASVAGVDVKGGVQFNNVNGNFSSATNTNDILVSGGVDLGTTAGARTITVSNNTTFSGVVSGNIANSVGFTKAGTGSLILSGNNTYAGTTTVSTGVLRASHANSLGSTGNGTTVSNGAALELSGGISIGAEALSLTGSGISSTGALRNISGNNAYGGVISLAGATTIGSDAGTLTLSSGSSITGTNANLTFVGAGNITISDAIATGSGTLTKTGSGTLRLTGQNTYQGATTVQNGTLEIASTGAIGNTSRIDLNNSGSILLVTVGDTLNNTAAINLNDGQMSLMGNFSETLGNLTSNGSSRIDLASFSGVLRFGGVGSWGANTQLAILNWNSGTQNIVFADKTNLSSYLNQISFYSNSGDLIGTASMQNYTGADGGTEIIAVPEPETYIIVMVFLLGFGNHQLRLARQGEGLLSRLTFLRQAKRQPLEGQPLPCSPPCSLRPSGHR